ncbi:MAG: S8 family serine peptidase [Paracoccaceae bacterium]
MPQSAAGELVTLELTDTDLATLLALGFRVLEERLVPDIGIVARRLAIPAGSTLEAARDQVRALPSGKDADFNHYYRTEEAPAPVAEPAVCNGQHCAFQKQIGWQVTTPFATCTTDVVIGVIDTGINPDHAAFSTARLDVHRLVPDSFTPSRAIHGTAVISLLIGSPDSRSPGLLPDARVVAVDAFHNDAGDERADVYTLAAGMDFLANQGVRVINMSLAGPPNSVLEAATAALVARGIIVIAAVGNGGPRAEPSYPAAYPGVIAVTAVDAGGTVYRRAGQGGHVDLAAPGVDVWTAASISGAKPKTGTSFAAPFVTAAAAAALKLNPGLDAATLTTTLAATARDLGEPGRDDVYGFGLLQAGQRCR